MHLIKYMTEGDFFNLEQPIKHYIAVEHVIHDPKTRTAKILVAKKDFRDSRQLLKEKLTSWVTDLDPDNIKQHNTPPEVAHIAKDDYSSTNDSFYSHSVETIMTFEFKGINFRNN